MHPACSCVSACPSSTLRYTHISNEGIHPEWTPSSKHPFSIFRPSQLGHLRNPQYAKKFNEYCKLHERIHREPCSSIGRVLLVSEFGPRSKLNERRVYQRGWSTTRTSATWDKCPHDCGLLSPIRVIQPAYGGEVKLCAEPNDVLLKIKTGSSQQWRHVRSTPKGLRHPVRSIDEWISVLLLLPSLLF